MEMELTTTMNVTDVQSLFAYDEWANGRLTAAASQLTSEEYTRELGASFGSVRGTLVHIMWGERRWLQRWVDGSALPDPGPNDFEDASSLRNGWSQIAADRRAFLADVTEERLQSTLSIRGQTYTLAELIKHITNHSTYHRGQIVLLLRLLGHAPPATDYRLFLTESRGLNGRGDR